MFLPCTLEELEKLGWKHLDIIIVTGDAYIDSPFSGTALIGKFLLKNGFKVGVISQPDLCKPDDILRLGSPRLFWGVNAGCTDSLVANYTSLGKKRKKCDFTPGGENNKRPDRATIVYTNLIKKYDLSKKPVILGGIEASLRRFAHFDTLSNSIRKSLLMDAKADCLVYGMGEYTMLNLAKRYSSNKPFDDLDGIVYLTKEITDDIEVFPDFEKVATDKKSFHEFYKSFYKSSSLLQKSRCAQRCMDRWVVQNPPYKMTTQELDDIHDIEFERTVHPYDRAKGIVKAEDIVKTSITSHRGCYGECNFCAISVHQGRSVVSRSRKSIINEVRSLIKRPFFKGIISDVGGATANMYATECFNMKKHKPCHNKSCLYPSVCKSLYNSQSNYLDLLNEIRNMSGVKKVFVASGLRCDLVISDKTCGDNFIKALVTYHTSGQVKLAPEHLDRKVLEYMGKPNLEPFYDFIERFRYFSKEYGLKKYFSCYILVAHPGCDQDASYKVKALVKRLGFRPEQVQIFTPTPSTWSTCMYYTGLDKGGNKIFVPCDVREKLFQKKLLSYNYK